MVREVKRLYETGQPVLVGTIAVETSEVISQLLNKEHIPHEVLNAKTMLVKPKLSQRQVVQNQSQLRQIWLVVVQILN